MRVTFPPHLQVIYRALPPSNQLDPFGAAAQHQLMVTNLRVCLLQRQPCPCQAEQPGTAALPTRHYAIYHFTLKGSCLCYGHAEQCVPARGSQGRLERSPSQRQPPAGLWVLLPRLPVCRYVLLQGTRAALPTIPGMEGCAGPSLKSWAECFHDPVSALLLS